ncbi:hypothetical protein BDQ17DRAFT_1306080 [Cyathus striatus]|nr:hypothetical protein BDQ17DRAFT_1306080 [Cyathus striatus]
MGQPRRRVSYIIPPPAEPIPRLQLPPRGSIPLGTVNPTLIYPTSSPNDAKSHDEAYQHPRHRLGVASLALDSTTLLTNKSAPEGILYSGGRDGMVISWDLGISMKKRPTSASTSPGSGVREGPLGTKHHWELITGWLDDSIDEEESESEGTFPVGSDGDVLGDVTSSLDRRGKQIGDLRARDRAQLEREKEWIPDMTEFKPETPSTFRQCAQTHTDWVNDILLCNFNQTLVSASSDGTVKAWSPHVTENVDPATVGRHTDYVRCLTACPTQNWVASGSFDRTIKLWDLTRSAPSTPLSSSPDPSPLITLTPPDSAGPKSSIYALSTDRYGTTIASGSPERVVRLWDPRAGRRTGKLVGHTDNIRAVLVSEDGKYLLTGSADASIKLWSLNTLRCLHTFTHHADSVWSLASTHPSLEVFYSGDRSGLLCRVDVEDCASVSEGECAVLCREGDMMGADGTEKAEGINKIVTLDDQLVWTASGVASVHRWRVPPRRMVRAAMSDGEWADRSPVITESPTASPTVPSSAGGRGHRNKGSMSLSRDTLSPPSFSAAGSVQSLSSPNPENDVTPQGHTSRPISRSFSGGSAYEPGKMPPSFYGISLDSLVRLMAPDYPPLGSATSAFFNRPRDPEVATMYSAASVMSIPHVAKPKPELGHGRPPLTGLFAVSASNSGQSAGSAVPSHVRNSSEDTGHLLTGAGLVLVPYEERELAMDAVPLVSAPDYTIHGSRGLVRCIILNTRVHALTVDTAGEVAVWDLARCVCLGRFERAEVAAASHSGSSAGGTGDHERGPRELLELVRERVEGEAVVTGWCTADTKTGVLTVHMTERAFDAEVYADEVGFAGDQRFTDESKLNLGKWVLKNLFWGFVKEEQRIQRKAGIGAIPGTARSSTDNVLPPSLARGSHHHDDHHHYNHHHSHRQHRESSNDSHHAHHHHHHHHQPYSPKPSRKSSSSPESTRKAYRMAATASTSSVVVVAPHIIPAVPPLLPTIPAPAPHLVTPSLIPLFPNSGNADGAHDIPPPLTSPGDAILTPTPHHTRTRSTTLDGVPPHAIPGPLSSAKEVPDYFSARRGSLVPSTPDDFSGWGGPGSIGKEPHTPNTPGGLMGRLKSFKMPGSKRPINDVPQTPAVGVVNTPILETPVMTSEPAESPNLTALQALLATPFAPASSSEAPHVSLPPNTVIIIGEESFPSYTTLYRGSTSLTQYDTTKLEEAMPLWLLEYLLLNKLPPLAQVAKLSFILLPWKGVPDGEVLPELLNTQQSKLTASRYLRVRKLVAHVQEKLDKPSPTPSASRTPSIRSSVDANHHLSGTGSNTHRTRPEDAYEILCNEALLPLDMNIAAVRQYVWRQGTELVMHYRRKNPAATAVV